MAKNLYTLTPEHRARLKPWAEKWIATAMSTEPMSAAEKADVTAAIHGMYAAAKLERPANIVYCASPISAQIAAGVAAGIWYLRANRGRLGAVFSEEEMSNAARQAIAQIVSHGMGNLIGVVDSATIAAAVAAADAATHGVTRSASFAATDAATRNATAATVATVVDAAYAATVATVVDAAYVATVAATRIAARGVTSSATRAATRDAVGAAVDAAAVDAAFVATVAAPRKATDAITRIATRDAVGVATRDATVLAVDDAVDVAAVDATRIATRDASNSRLVSFLIACASRAWALRNGGNLWPGWSCYLSFFRHVAKLDIDYIAWQHYEVCAEHSGPRYMHAQFCIVSDRPDTLVADEVHRSHSAVGPSHRWRDGWEIYHWRGVRVPKAWIMSPETLSPETPLTWPDVEQRTAAAEIVGWDKVLAKLEAKVIDPGENPYYGELIEVQLPDAGRQRFVRALCGTGRTVCFPVGTEFATAIEANARSYRMSVEEFRAMGFRA